MKFTAGDNLTGFSKELHNMFMKNELRPSRKTEDAYEISHAKIANSGYSFGPLQWDLYNNKAARDLFEDILKKAEDNANIKIIDDSMREKILGIVSNRKERLSKEQRDLINDALASSYGVQKINEAYLKAIEEKVNYINSVINSITNETNKTIIQNSDIYKLFIGDVHNQFGTFVNEALVKFLNGETVPLPYGGDTVSIRGELGLEDLIRFHLSTSFGKDHSKILMRRLSNIIESIGVNNVKLTDEDKKFFAEELPKLLGSSFKRIMQDPDNAAIRELYRKSCSDLGVTALVVFTGEPGIDGITEAISTTFSRASKAEVRISPVAVDLDDDGIETISSDNGAYFDHNANGFAERTGWVSSDDGLLAMDRNEDGQISGGKELFGDETVLKDGGKAANGFQALTELDDDGNGKIDASDEAYAQLKVWRDIDGDGYSSPDELKSLEEAGIASVNTGYGGPAFIDAQGNEHRQVGSFTWDDGTLGIASDIWFKTDKVYSIAEEWLPVPEDMAGLPDLPGYGNLYDLHQAMVRDESGQLIDLVKDFIAQTDDLFESPRDGVGYIPLALDLNQRNQLMEAILFKWAGSDGLDPDNAQDLNGVAIYGIDARKLAVLEKFMGEKFEGIMGNIPHFDAGVLLRDAYQKVFEMFYGQLMAQTHLKDLYGKIAYHWDESLENVRGDLIEVANDLNLLLAEDPDKGKLLLAEFVRTLRGLGADQVTNFNDFKATLVGSSDPKVAFIIDSAFYNLDMGSSGVDLIVGSAKKIGSLEDDEVLTFTFPDGLANETDAFAGGEGDDCLVADSDGDLLYGQEGKDFLFTALGNDIRAYGGEGTDGLMANGDNAQLYGEDGNDFLYVIKGNNVNLFGGLGDDFLLGYAANVAEPPGMFGMYAQVSEMMQTLYDMMPGSFNSFYSQWDQIFDGAPGNDLLDGSAGDDFLLGGDGNDTYVFGRAYGLDGIYDLGGAKDKILFRTDVIPDDIMVSRDANKLYFTITDTGERLTVNNWSAGSDYRIEQAEFSNGTVWNLDDDWLTTRFSTVTAGADFLWGTEGSDILSGCKGDDQLIGNGGKDTLNGGSGDDQLDGGTGADTMIGGAGNDTYFVDDRRDKIIEIKNEGLDRVKSSISYTLGENLENLTLITESTDPSIMDDYLAYYLNGGSAVDGTGNKLDNILTGNMANNILFGGAGNDTLNGRFGVDTLSGGAGNDTYIFGRGYGQDRVSESQGGKDVLSFSGKGITSYDILDEAFKPFGLNAVDYIETMGGFQSLALVYDLLPPWAMYLFYPRGYLNNYFSPEWRHDYIPPDVSPDDVFVSRDEKNLYFRIMGADNVISLDDTGDKLTVGKWFSCSANRIESVEFNDGTTWKLTEDWLNVRFTTPTDKADFLWGTAKNDTLSGLSGNDWLVGNGGNDLLDGGAGIDIMQGGHGKDTYIVDNIEDTVLEEAHEGGDSVRSSVTYTLPDNVENLTLTELMPIDGTGNELNNTIYGNVASNVLMGGDGSDSLNAGDGDDSLDGGAGNDNLAGGEGADVLIGGAGRDSLVGGAGSDTYLVGRTDSKDTITESVGLPDDMDTVKMGDEIGQNEPVLVKKNKDLYIFVDAHNYLKVENQFYKPNYGVERLEVSDGYYVAKSDIENIINTMSTINNDRGMDVIEKFNAMRNDQNYLAVLTESWRNPNP